ncbi:MAG TPA: prepilin-type N-terminal cleavage/methylation domain-containing protein [Caldithrix abyssi]|uniref:Prepilin-type N-terminal cleavage/methylation domain-containing protein n=1 Tax=Caldithrix abyssi TaxID=187145 RepID=A0A7V1LNJ2_CALAY|nr:prepilin-type N-terminal cleavage/methylation domain-containing protein [Caldithrix abyssi]
MKKRVLSQAGFTLMEMSVALTVLGVVGVIAFNIIHNQVNTFGTVFSNTAAVSDIRKTVRLMRRDFQNLDNSAINTMKNSRLVFKDNDGEEVTYLFNNGKLTRNEKVVLENVARAPFSYLNSAQKETGASDSLRFIGVNLSVVAINADTVSVTETIYVRN